MFHRSIAGEPYWTVSTDGAAVPSSRLRPATASSPIHRAASTRLMCPCATRMTGPRVRPSAARASTRSARAVTACAVSPLSGPCVQIVQSGTCARIWPPVRPS